MNNKKKSNMSIILMVIVAILLTGCAATATDIQTNGIENSGISYVEEESTLPSITALPSEISGEIESEGSERVTEDDLIISHYYGRIETEDGLVLYDITIKQLAEYQYIMDLQFYDYGSKELIQQLSYNLRDDFMPDTVYDGLQIADVNNDGNEDIIIDLGIYGKFKFAVCYIYNQDQKGYEQLMGYDELYTPEYVNDQGFIFENWRSGSTEYAINKYYVDKNQLVLVASLNWGYGSSPNHGFTEKLLMNGEMITIKENVPADEIDSKEWNNRVPND